MNKYSALILTAAAFWGTMGLFSRTLGDAGIPPLTVCALRIIWGAIFLSLFLAIKDRKLFRVKVKDLTLMAVAGGVSVFAMSFFYVSAIDAASMSAAAILLYTAPFIVTVASALIYKEKITVKTVIALVTAFAGCVMIAGVSGETTPRGVILGLLSGVTYASYSIIGKKVLEKYSPYTLTAWAFISGAAVAVIAVGPVGIANAVVTLGCKGTLFTDAMGLVTATLPFLLYTAGLSGTPAGRASVMATAEPLAATLAGLIVFREVPGIFAIIGMLMIVFAILLLNNFGRRDGA